MNQWEKYGILIIFNNNLIIYFSKKNVTKIEDLFNIDLYVYWNSNINLNANISLIITIKPLITNYKYKYIIYLKTFHKSVHIIFFVSIVYFTKAYLICHNYYTSNNVITSIYLKTQNYFIIVT